jgi:hypothetical protein
MNPFSLVNKVEGPAPSGTESLVSWHGDRCEIGFGENKSRDRFSERSISASFVTSCSMACCGSAAGTGLRLERPAAQKPD